MNDKACDTSDLNSAPQELGVIHSKVKMATVPLNLQVPERFTMKPPNIHQFSVGHHSPCGLNILACDCPLAFLDLQVHITIPMEDENQNPLLSSGMNPDNHKKVKK